MSRFRITALINSILFALFLTVGIHLDNHKTIINITNNPTDTLGLILLFLFFIATFYMIINFIYDYLDSVNKKRYNLKNNRLINFIFYKNPFKSMVFVSLLVSGFYLVFFYPGILSFDGKWQLNSFMRVWLYNDHHPAILSAIMGGLFNLGTHFIDNNFGIFLYIIIQVIVNALVYGYTLKIMNKIDSPLSIRIISFIFFGFFPYLNINSITYMKDVMYYLIFLFIFLYQYNHFEIEKDINFKFTIKLLLLYLLFFIFRNTAFYVSIVSLLALGSLYLVKKNMKYVKVIVFCLVSVLIFNTCYHKIILPHFDIGEGLVREKISIPLQQTARYLNYFPDDITKKEEKRILAIFKCDLDTIASKYNPYRSDAVKEQLIDYPTNEQLLNYFKAWFNMFRRHPEIYIDATLNNIYDYFYSEHRNFMGEDIGFYNQSENRYTNVYFNSKTEAARNIFRDIADKICHTKVIGLLYSCYFYVWMLVFITLYLLHRKYYDLFMYLFPLFVTIMFCVISPVNGHLRYLFPVVVTILPVYAIVLSRNRKSNN